MSTPIDKLSKILRLEAEKYQDRAILGGLARYADTWSREAEAMFSPEGADADVRSLSDGADADVRFLSDGADADVRSLSDGADTDVRFLRISDWIEKVANQLRAYSGLSEINARQEALTALSEILAAGPPSRTPAPEETPSEASGEDLTGQMQTSVAKPVRSSGNDARTGLDSAITALQGVGPRQAKRLAKLGVHTIRDMICLFPRRHDDYSQLKPINRLEYGEEVTIIARVKNSSGRDTRRGGSVFQANLSDGTGVIQATWFNQPYLRDRITPGRQIVVSGKVDEYLGRLCFTSPEWEFLEEELLHTARIVPVYPLTEGIRIKWLRRLIKRTVDYWSKRLPDHLPASVREEAGLLDLETAIVQAHFPDNQALLKRARYRLAFDELFVLQIGLLRQRHLWRSEAGRALAVEDATLESFIHSLSFDLTHAQQQALGQIVSDMRSERPMNRLLQGDVGSGKTVVAAAAMMLTVAAGAQAAMMAPTAILAEQHHKTLSQLIMQSSTAQSGMPPVIRLLTGGVQGREREEIYTGLADGSVDIVVGTHALIQEGVQFKDLALAVIDEQHRFGVRQRAALRQKGYNPHLLMMTATPIPRSLELTVWGHMDVSIIDEMPPGRKPITTRLALPTERERAYSFVRSQVRAGHQAFIICPLVEESEKIEAKAAIEEHARLQEEIFPDLRLGLLHGRMKGEEKEATMVRFAEGELDILVATSVVEVGIDMPNATVMLIEGADRFGLAQLHQFRGRVGRGEHESYCLLVSSSTSPAAQERLQAIEATNDGFVLAQKDLEMRGPGEFIGTRQSGLPDLQLADVMDLQLVEAAREAAWRFFETDPELIDPDNRLLARRVAQFWEEKGEIS
jgi:ATP-dependent DNA helicase RecG